MTLRPGLSARLALFAIRGYQRYLSPIKGFSCALRIATGGDSCSAYGYRVIARTGLRVGLRLLRRRLNGCAHISRQAAHVLNPSFAKQAGHCDLAFDVADFSMCCDIASCGCDLYPSNRKANGNSSGKIRRSPPTDELTAARARVEAAKRARQQDRSPR